MALASTTPCLGGPAFVNQCLREQFSCILRVEQGISCDTTRHHEGGREVTNETPSLVPSWIADQSSSIRAWWLGDHTRN